MSLRDRCKAYYREMGINAMLRQGSPVDDLMAFIVSETGRAADDSLKETLPLCLYFETKEDREEFIELFQQAKPGLLVKRLP